MSSYFIESFKIDKLWGYRPINLTFYRNVNILIGPNGSGKTTILNLLHSILSGDLRSISNVNFEQAEIGLRSFKGRSVRTIKVNPADGFLKFKVGKKVYKFPTRFFANQKFARNHFYLWDNSIVKRIQSDEIDELTALVPLVWLPVSRHLSLTEDEEEHDTKTEPSESVDLHLKELLADLSRYRSELNAQLSKRYRDFERQVLSVILYSKEYDQIYSILKAVTSSLPTETEKDQLLKAFDDVGLLNEQMQNRINEHFRAIEKSVKRIGQFSENPKQISELDHSKQISEFDHILVLPLISRTKNMVELARKLEKHRTDIFAPLHLYENTVNSFLEDKIIKVDESDGVKIELPSKSELNWQDLSSGEKQILILLTEILLKVDQPVVYIADEPELSLHVKWQEKLLESIVKLGGQKQIIVATHSPDIVGPFRDNVITLGKES